MSNEASSCSSTGSRSAWLKRAYPLRMKSSKLSSDIAHQCFTGFQSGAIGRSSGEERLKGFEPSTFCMASRRSSQLSYSRAGAEYSRGPGALRELCAAALDVVGGVEVELEPGEAAALVDVLATPAGGEPVHEQEAVSALRLEAVAGAGGVRARVEDLDANLLVRRGDPDLDRLVLAGAAVLDGVRDELGEKQGEPVADGV